MDNRNKMDINDILQTGSDILEDVMEAVETNNYIGLGNTIRDRVNRMQQGRTTSERQATPGSFANRSKARPAQSTSRNQATPGSFANRNMSWQERAGAGYGRGQNQTSRAGQANYANPYQKKQQTGLQQITNFALVPVTKTNGTVETAFGAIGTAIFGVGTLSSLGSFITHAVSNSTVTGTLTGSLFLTLLLGLCTVGSFFLFRKGRKHNGLVDRYYQIGKLLGNAEYFSISQIASKIGETEKKLRKELKQMIKAGFIPQARLDTKETTVMLTDHAYGLYQQAEAERVQREKKEKEKESAADEFASVEDQATREILTQGTAYLKHVREINDIIPDTDEMSTKLYRLEEIMHRIFDQVKKQPRSATGLRRFMDYYLPTTDKLLDAYVELDSQPDVGDNITKTKNEIKEAMDTINDAYEKLLDSMFEDVAWDISSDISVMKTMMEQDGLREKELVAERRE